VGRCRLNRVETSVESAWFHRLNLEYDEPLSNVAFNFRLRGYTLANTIIFIFSGYLIAFNVTGTSWSDFGWAGVLYILLHVVRGGANLLMYPAGGALSTSTSTRPTLSILLLLLLILLILLLLLLILLLRTSV
jgi:hypothetical protein